MARLLAIDTAMEACSAALIIDDEVFARSIVEPRAHARLVLAMVRELLDDAGLALEDLDTLAFGRGPGAFTGVRIAAGVVQGLALGSGLSVIPVSNLQALAQAAMRNHDWQRVLVCTDARMGEVYFGAFVREENGSPVLMGTERICAPENVIIPDIHGWCGVGSGWQAYPMIREQWTSQILNVDTALLSTAEDIATLAVNGRESAVDAAEALPVYLRDKVAWKKN